MFAGPRTRMFRVWGLLAAAMLLGSALLGWLEPKPHRNALAGAPRESMLNDAATLDDRTSPLRHWNGVEIVGVPGANTRNRGTLTAVVRQPELHFLINASGAAEVQPGWTQQAAVGQDGSIRIGLEQSADDGTAHIKQIVRLTELITELRTTVSADEVSTLPVWFNGGSDQQPLANQLRRFLK